MKVCWVERVVQLGDTSVKPSVKGRGQTRHTFLSSGNASAYQSVTDRIYHVLPPLSNSVIQGAFTSQLRLPQLLDPQSCRKQMLLEVI
ncbi:hypothetical protein AV530_005601 [Patagioenas fasciata monilis]|uniref:Uncharacterized protein n=1 Tax=Patagioenas fasciata monilis TaxID=372326 RepID=A0A1V4JLZ0_PATFA|nr:hypothetical protein AV530_005601 [Patagioenas fasciata monilis]